jgi:hypothetical protein
MREQVSARIRQRHVALTRTPDGGEAARSKAVAADGPPGLDVDTKGSPRLVLVSVVDARGCTPCATRYAIS